MNTHDWLTELFGSELLCDQWLTVCWRENQIRWNHFPATDLERAAHFIDKQAQRSCTWVGCCPLTDQPDQGRGRTDHTGALIGVWADLDIAGHCHADNGPLPLPETLDDAMAILACIDLEPTHILHTGGGLQVWWLFTEPWVFNDLSDRLAAQALSAGFGRTLQNYGRIAGWHVDDVSDLARILRPPSTYNRKQRKRPLPVTRIGGSTHPVSITDIESRITELPSATVQKETELRTTAGSSPAEVFSRHTEWIDILSPHGWRPYQSNNGQRELGSICPNCNERVEMWSHPQVPLDHLGRPDHVSATACHVLYSFSESRPNGLPPRTPLTKFRTWALLDHHGDMSAAARSIVIASRQEQK